MLKYICILLQRLIRYDFFDAHCQSTPTVPTSAHPTQDTFPKPSNPRATLTKAAKRREHTKAKNQSSKRIMSRIILSPYYISATHWHLHLHLPSPPSSSSHPFPHLFTPGSLASKLEECLKKAHPSPAQPNQPLATQHHPHPPIPIPSQASQKD
jgi:hypothetical protein